MNNITKAEALKRLRERLTRTNNEVDCKRIVKLIEKSETEEAGR